MPRPPLQLASPRAPGPAPVVLRVDAARMITALVLIAFAAEWALVLADATINYAKWTELSPIRRFFNITREDGLASWFGVTQTWMAALTLGLITWVVARGGAPRWKVRAWGAVTLFFGYMAMDDGSKLHERLGSAFDEYAADHGPSEQVLALFPSYPWQLLVLPFFVGMGLFMAWFLWRELAERRPRLMVAAAVGLMAAAVVLDFFEGMDPEDALNLHTHIRLAFGLSEYDVSHFSKSIEECMEMMSITLLWAVFLRFLAGAAPELRVVLGPPAGGAPG